MCSIVFSEHFWLPVLRNQTMQIHVDTFDECAKKPETFSGMLIVGGHIADWSICNDCSAFQLTLEKRRLSPLTRIPMMLKADEHIFPLRPPLLHLKVALSRHFVDIRVNEANGHVIPPLAIGYSVVIFTELASAQNESYVLLQIKILHARRLDARGTPGVLRRGHRPALRRAPPLKPPSPGPVHVSGAFSTQHFLNNLRI